MNYSKTRFSEFGYIRHGKDWRLLLIDPLEPVTLSNVIGPVYRTKLELLSDLHYQYSFRINQAV